jgi:hypothetical protein
VQSYVLENTMNSETTMHRVMTSGWITGIQAPKTHKTLTIWTLIINKDENICIGADRNDVGVCD